MRSNMENVNYAYKITVQEIVMFMSERYILLIFFSFIFQISQTA